MADLNQRFREIFVEVFEEVFETTADRFREAIGEATSSEIAAFVMAEPAPARRTGRSITNRYPADDEPRLSREEVNGRILEALLSAPTGLAMGEIVTATGIAAKTIGPAIRALRDEKRVTMTGDKKTARYAAAGAHDITDPGTVLHPTAPDPSAEPTSTDEVNAGEPATAEAPKGGKGKKPQTTNRYERRSEAEAHKTT